MIRPATLSDVPQMVEMGRRFFEASGYSDITSFSPKSLKETIEGIIANENGALLVVEKEKLVGMAIAILYPFYFNVEHKTAQEMLWWVDQEHRGVGAKLLDALTSLVKAKGAQSFSMIALERLAPERVGGIYERRGFRPSERSYIKKV